MLDECLRFWASPRKRPTRCDLTPPAGRFRVTDGQKNTPSGSKYRVPAAPVTGPLKSPSNNNLAGPALSKCELVHNRGCFFPKRRRGRNQGAISGRLLKSRGSRNHYGRLYAIT